jgi:hypothetical protein
MFYGQDRRQLRRVYVQAWAKHRRGEPLAGIEAIIVAIAARHPEYHALLETAESAVDRDWQPELGETNPFLHLAMHTAIEEGLSVDEPPGVRALYQVLLGQLPDEHAVQHHMMECLGEMLWQASRAGTLPDTGSYLACLRRLAAR